MSYRILKFSPIRTSAVMVSTAILLAGCGGGSSTQQGTTVSADRTGKVTISVAWPLPAPAASRLIPTAANCIKVVFGTNGALPPVLLQRPNVPANPNYTITTPVTSVAIADVPVGTQPVTAAATPNADGTGTAQAFATTQVKVVANTTTTLNLALKTTIVKLQVKDLKGKAVIAPITGSQSRDSGPILTVDMTPGETDSMAVSALDANNNTVLVDPKNWKWAPAQGASLNVAANQDTANVTAGSAGDAMVTVTEGESGVSGTVQVNIAAGGIWSQLGGNPQGSFCGSGATAAGVLSGHGTLSLSSLYFTVLEDPAGGVQFTLGDGNLYHMSSGGAVTAVLSTQGALVAMGANGTRYLQSNTGIQAVAAGGTTLWNATVTGFAGSNVAALSADGVLYVPTGNNVNTLTAIDTSTGAVKWNAKVGGYISARAAIGQTGMVYTAASTSSGYTVYALNPAAGTVVWSTQINNLGGSLSQVAVAPGGQVIVQDSADVQALSAASGATLWTAGSSADLDLMAVTSGGVVLAALDRSKGGPMGVQGIDAATGVQLWSMPDEPGYSFWQAAGGAGDGTAYLIHVTGPNPSFTYLVAADARSGSTKWTFQLQNEGTTYTGNMAPIECSNGNIYLMDYSSGGATPAVYQLDAIK